MVCMDVVAGRSLQPASGPLNLESRGGQSGAQGGDALLVSRHRHQHESLRGLGQPGCRPNEIPARLCQPRQLELRAASKRAWIEVKIASASALYEAGLEVPGRSI